jgi:hypothetical protein
MKRYLLILLSIAMLLSACAPAAVESNPPAAATAEPVATEEAKAATQVSASEAELDGAAIVFHRTGGVAGVDEEWKIYPDGRVVASEGEQRAIEAGQVATLLQAIEALGFFEMKDSYGQLSQCNDCFTYKLTVSSGGKVKSVTTIDNASDAPPELGQVLEQINTLLTGN